MPTAPATGTPRVLSHFIGGRRVEGHSNRFGDVFNPATGAVSAQVPLATADEVSDVVLAAREAFPAWAATPRHSGRDA